MQSNTSRVVGVVTLAVALAGGGCGGQPTESPSAAAADAPLEIFCRHYKSILQRKSPEPPFTGANGDAVAAMEKAIELGKASEVDRLVEAFVKVDRAMDMAFEESGPSGPEDAGKAYVESYRVAVEECTKAGIDVVPGA